MSMSTLDSPQVIKTVFDAVNNALQVNVVATTASAATTTAINDGVDVTKKATVTASSALKVDGSAVTQPVSGTFFQATQPVSATSLPLPTGASTEATLSTLNGKVTACNTGATVVSSSALPSGASTEATLSTLNGKVPSNLTVTSTRLLVDGSGVTQPISAASLPLPSGAATSAKQDTGNTSVASIDTKTPALGQALAAASVPVVLTAAQLTTLTPLSTVAATQSGTWTTNDTGFTTSEFVRNDYTSVNVLTSAYLQLIASTAAAYQEFEIFDSSGQTLKIAFGAAASEVDKFLVVPGGNGRFKRNVPASTRISIKAVSATASLGEISINLYG